MRKMLSVSIALALGSILFAVDNLKKEKAETTPSLSLPSQIENNSRTEQWILLMLDSYGDGWNGASLDLSVNDQVVLDDATIATGYEAVEYFDVSDGDAISTVWTSGSFDSECSFGIYDGTGALVADSETSGTFDLSITATFGGRMVIAGVLDFDLLVGGNSGKATIVKALADIDDISVYGLGTATNGGGTDGVEYTFPVQSMSEGDVLWVVRDAAEYANYFGAEIWATINYTEVPDDQSGGVNQNGDDAVELFFNGEAFDVFGLINVDGTGEN